MDDYQQALESLLSAGLEDLRAGASLSQRWDRGFVNGGFKDDFSEWWGSNRDQLLGGEDQVGRED